MAEPWWWMADTEDDGNWLSEFGGEDIRALVRECNRLRASLDPDNAAAVEAWARYSMTAIGETWEPNQADLDDAAALLRARREAERP